MIKFGKNTTKSVCGLLLILLLPLSIWAKERLILLPVQGVEDQDTGHIYRTALSKSLSRQYEVLSGTQVDKKLTDIFAEESKKTQCSEEACYKAMVLAFQAELVATAIVKKIAGGYLLSLQINNLLENKQVYSESLPCEQCNAFAVQRALGSLVEGSTVGFVAATSALVAGVSAIEEIDAGGVVTQSGRAVLFLTSEPVGASVYLGQIKAGVTPYQNMNLTAGQRLQVTLKKSLYHDKTVAMTLHGGRNEPQVIPLNPAFGGLEITSDPVGATVWLGGEELGVTPYSQLNMASGQHLLSLHKALYESIDNAVVTIQDGAVSRQQYTLTPRFGTLSVDVKPLGTRVSVSQQGTTVADFHSPANYQLLAGEYRVTVSHSGYASRNYTLQVAVGQTAILHAQSLRRLEGQLWISSEPFEKGARILVDGKDRGVVPEQLSLAVGKHRIAIQGQHAWGESEVEITDGSDDSLKVSLRPWVQPSSTQHQAVKKKKGWLWNVSALLGKDTLGVAYPVPNPLYSVYKSLSGGGESPLIPADSTFQQANLDWTKTTLMNQLEEDNTTFTVHARVLDGSLVYEGQLWAANGGGLDRGGASLGLGYGHKRWWVSAGVGHESARFTSLDVKSAVNNTVSVDHEIDYPTGYVQLGLSFRRLMFLFRVDPLNDSSGGYLGISWGGGD
jgi:hypothetical protein